MEQSRSNIVISLIIILAFLLFFPLIWVHAFIPLSQPFLLRLFTPASFTLLLLGFLCFTFRNAAIFLYQWWLGPPMLLAVLINLWQIQCAGIDYGLEQLATGLFFLIVPLVAAMNEPVLRRLLPGTALFLWLGSVVISSQEWFHGQLVIGIAGNYNWNATTMAVSALLIAGWLTSPERCRFRHCRLAALCLLILVTLPLIYICRSRGTILSFSLAVVLFYWYELRRFRRIIVAVGIMLAMIGGLIILIKGNIPDISRLDQGIRPHLWAGTFKVISGHFWSGTSAVGFENALSGNIPAEYFLSPVAAARSNHPHNQILYIFAIWGFLGVLSWLTMTLTPIVMFFRRYRQWHKADKFMVCAMLTIFFHGQLDLPMSEWPTNVLFMLLLGCLWRMVIVNKHRVPVADVTTLPRLTVGLMSLIAAALFMFAVGYGSLHYRGGMSAVRSKDGDTAAVMLDQATKYCPDEPMYFFQAAINSSKRLQNQALSLAYIRELNPLFHNFATVNAMAGRILMQQGKVREALPYLAADVRSYPLSASSHFFYYLALDRIGKKAEAENELKMTMYSLNLKGLDQRALPFLMQNPYYELFWHRIPPEIPRRNQ